MAYGTVNADTLVTSTSGGILGAGNASIMKNRCINGDMRIDQRNAGASVTPTANPTYLVDRWFFGLQQASKMSFQQSTTAPVGFNNSLLATSLSAYTPLSSDYQYLGQRIEGYNVADLGWGTANAKTVTLSAWVYSSLTGTFSGSLSNAGADRSYPFNYTISSANTWTNISVTIAGDTSGTWNTTNGRGIVVSFNLGSGSTYLGTAGSWAGAFYVGATGSVQPISTSGATFYITGVQLEVGSSATGFEYVNYQTSLANCQRYYYKIKAVTSNPLGGMGFSYSSTLGIFIIPFPVTLRTIPSALDQSGTAGDYACLEGSTIFTATSVPAFNSATVNQAGVEAGFSGLTLGRALQFRSINANAYLGWSAEL